MAKRGYQDVTAVQTTDETLNVEVCSTVGDRLGIWIRRWIGVEILLINGLDIRTGRR